MQPPAHTPYLTTGQAARHLGISKPTLFRAVERGDIRLVNRTPGGYLRFRPADVEAFARRLSFTGEAYDVTR